MSEPSTHDRTDALAPNHHASYPGFAGVRGALMALLFAAKGSDRGRFVADLAEVGADDHVVDIGCGPGNAARIAAARGARATGVDPSPVMLSVARCLTRPGRRIMWADGAAESIPVADGDATIVWSVACVHHWADIDAGLAEVLRVLAPGGRLFAVERRTTADATGTASHGWTEEQADAFAVACRDAGYVDVEVSSETADQGVTLVVRAVRP